ncbi:MAG: tetratricopeptide repeat protein, partial [Bdellovibrionales bacterium]
LTDAGKDLSPIEALGLFTDFKALLPAGEGGNVVRKNLAERLIQIDLLDPASKLLRDEIKYATTADERVQVATRLAAVRLLDHKAKEALAVLEESQAESVGQSLSIQAQRQLLRVRALSELGKYDEALAAFPPGNSKPSLLLRADIAMRARNWPDAISALMSLIGPPNDKPISEEKASWLVTAALAMAQKGDTDGLDKLAIDYGDAMDKTKKGNTFKILTRPEKMTEFKDLQSASANLNEVDMFRSVLDSYRTAKDIK